MESTCTIYYLIIPNVASISIGEFFGKEFTPITLLEWLPNSFPNTFIIRSEEIFKINE